MTPLIDMTFQLLAFFRVLINFSQNEQNEEVRLPESELAKPAEAPLESPITLHVKSDSAVIIGGETVSIAGLRPFLLREANTLKSQNKQMSDATVIIRADRLTPTGKIQQLIQVCQVNGLEKFALRAKEEVGH
jgi:biopolymer transport protein ExbD